MPVVFDVDVENNQSNIVNFTAIDNRTAHVAVLNQGWGQGLAGQLLSAQEQALHSEASALHTEVLDRQREALVSETRGPLAPVEQQAAEELSQSNLPLNE